jgi:hypothetical protein
MPVFPRPPRIAYDADSSIKGPWAIMHRGFGVPVLFVFPLNPQSWTVSHPSRGQVHQTVEANFLDDFSGRRAVASRCVMRGTFGFNPQYGGVIGAPLTGSLMLKSFETVWETFNALSRELKNRAGGVQELIIPSRLTYWRVWIDRLDYRTESRDPLLYYYDISMVRLEDYLSLGGPSLPPNLVPPIVSSTLRGLFSKVTTGASSLLGGLF